MENVEESMLTIGQFIKDHGINMECHYVTVGTDTDIMPDGTKHEWMHDQWLCTLKRETKVLATPFKQGLAHRKINPRKAAHTVGYSLMGHELKRYQQSSHTIKPEKWVAMSDPLSPELDTVLDSLMSDAICYDDARDFEDFAANLGYSTDSRKAEATYRACGELAKQLRHFLGDDLYQTLLYKVERL